MRHFHLNSYFHITSLYKTYNTNVMTIYNATVDINQLAQNVTSEQKLYNVRHHIALRLDAVNRKKIFETVGRRKNHPKNTRAEIKLLKEKLAFAVIYLAICHPRHQKNMSREPTTNAHTACNENNICVVSESRVFLPPREPKNASTKYEIVPSVRGDKGALASDDVQLIGRCDLLCMAFFAVFLFLGERLVCYEVIATIPQN